MTKNSSKVETTHHFYTTTTFRTEHIITADSEVGVLAGPGERLGRLRIDGRVAVTGGSFRDTKILVQRSKSSA